MKPSNSSSGVFKPFKDLKALLESKSVELQPAPAPASKEPNEDKTDRRPDHTIFKEAMTGVKKISRTKCAAQIPLPPEVPDLNLNPDHESAVQLENLVKLCSSQKKTIKKALSQTKDEKMKCPAASHGVSMKDELNPIAVPLN